MRSTISALWITSALLSRAVSGQILDNKPEIEVLQDILSAADVRAQRYRDSQTVVDLEASWDQSLEGIDSAPRPFPKNTKSLWFGCDGDGLICQDVPDTSCTIKVDQDGAWGSCCGGLKSAQDVRSPNSVSSECCSGRDDRECSPFRGCFDFRNPEDRKVPAPPSSRSAFGWDMLLYCGSDRPYCIREYVFKASIEGPGIGDATFLTCVERLPGNGERVVQRLNPHYIEDYTGVPGPESTGGNSNSDTPPDKNPDRQTVTILGIVIGGLVAFAIIALVLFVKLRDKNREQMIELQRQELIRLRNLPPATGPVEERRETLPLYTPPADGIIPGQEAPPPDYVKCLEGCSCESCKPGDGTVEGSSAAHGIVAEVDGGVVADDRRGATVPDVPPPDYAYHNSSQTAQR